MKKVWEGKLRCREERVQVALTTGEGWSDISTAREMDILVLDWYDAEKIEDRTPAESKYDIWVAEFIDGSELLIEYWRADNQLTVAYRSMRSYSWGPPSTLAEMVTS